LNWLGLKKNYHHLTPSDRVNLIDRGNTEISLVRQAELLNISRSSIYYEPVPISQDEVDLMNLIDQVYTESPYYGSRKIKEVLKREHKTTVNRKHIQRLMREMGIEAIYPKRKFSLSDPDSAHKKYPYLLRNLTINRPNQVWGTDITYLKLSQGFAYLVAIMDWFSRYVVAWEVSNSLEIEFVIRNLENALKIAVPDICNADQGSHFTSPQHTGLLELNNVQVSMDGRGRCMDNIFTERLWRNVKYEDIYIKSYNNPQEARLGLTEYFGKYNNRRPHQSLNYQTPAEVYFNKII